MKILTTGALELAMWGVHRRGGAGHIEAGTVDSTHPGWDILYSDGIELARARVA